MTKVLITGGGGYIGSISADILLRGGYEIVIIDNFSTGFKQPLKILQEKFGKQKMRIYNLDLTDDDLPRILKQEDHIDVVIHYAAFCSVDESVRDPELYFKNNVTGSINLLNAIIDAGVKKLVFSSSCAVYGESEYLPIDEAHPRQPLSPYGESKKMVEDMIYWYGILKDLNYVILRYFNVCGALEDGTSGDAKNPSIHLIQNVVKGALGLESFSLSYPEVDTQDKSPIRDYVDVVDLGLAHKKALEYLLDGSKSEIINLGSGNGHSVLEIIKIVEEITGKKLQVTQGIKRKGDPAKLIASVEKAKKILKWKPEKSLAESVKNLVTWYRNHPQGWEY